MWNIARHFYTSSFRRAVNSILDRTFLSVSYKNRIKIVLNCIPMCSIWMLYFNNLLTTGCYILYVKIITKYRRKGFFSFIYILCLYVLPVIYTVSSDGLSKVKTINHYGSNLHVSINQCCCKTYPTYRSPRAERTTMPD